MSITFDSSVSEINYNGNPVSEVIWNGTSVWSSTSIVAKFTSGTATIVDMTLHLWKDGADTGKTFSINGTGFVVYSGTESWNSIVDTVDAEGFTTVYDYLKVDGFEWNYGDDSGVFNPYRTAHLISGAIEASDANKVLDHHVYPETKGLTAGSAAWHAADANNNGFILADDSVAILRDIVALNSIDKFFIHNDGGVYSLHIKGDINFTGTFNDTYKEVTV